MKRIAIVLLILMAMTGISRAKVDLVTLPSRDTVQLTGVAIVVAQKTHGVFDQGVAGHEKRFKEVIEVLKSRPGDVIDQ